MLGASHPANKLSLNMKSNHAYQMWKNILWENVCITVMKRTIRHNQSQLKQ